MTARPRTRTEWRRPQPWQPRSPPGLSGAAQPRSRRLAPLSRLPVPFRRSFLLAVRLRSAPRHVRVRGARRSGPGPRSRWSSSPPATPTSRRAAPSSQPPEDLFLPLDDLDVMLDAATQLDELQIGDQGSGIGGCERHAPAPPGLTRSGAAAESNG